jgi:hypothetical protein
VPGSVLDGKGDVDPNPPVRVDTEAESRPTGAVAPPAGLATDAACERLAKLREQRCAWAMRFPPEVDDPAACKRSLDTWVSPETPDHEMLARTIACWALECDAAASCMMQVKTAAPPPAPRACGEEGTAPILVDRATWSSRRGGGVKRFGDIVTSEQEPLEVCGIDGEVEWLTRATCKGGSRPFATPEAANSGRDSYAGRGGRCNSILDRYTVKCPEQTYTLYVDRYVCPMP